MIPRYLLPPTVPGVKRCYFEFRSQEVLSPINRYRGKKRYRFNKFYPLTDRFPEVSYEGLQFIVSPGGAQGLIGIKTPWDLPVDGEVIFRFSSSDVQLHEPTGFAEVGVGFLQHNAPWWWQLDSLSFFAKRTIASPASLSFNTLHNTIIPTASSVCGIGNSFTFHVKRNSDSFVIQFAEYLFSNPTPVATASYTFPLETEEAGEQAIVMYCRAVDASATFTLARTDFIGCEDEITPLERVFFHENPAEYTPPIGPIQTPVLDIYSQPHTAFIEDASIEISSPLTPASWFNLLCYLVDSTAEPMVFYDIEGNAWLTCFAEVTGAGKKSRGDTVTGYTLTLQVLVVH